jgi:hypothetical protein
MVVDGAGAYKNPKHEIVRVSGTDISGGGR